VKQVTATLEFTHSVDPADWRNSYQSKLVGEPKYSKATIRFNVVYGPHHRVAYVRTSALVLPDGRISCGVLLSKGLTRPGRAPTQADVEHKVLVPTSTVSSASDRWRNDRAEQRWRAEQILQVETTAAAKPRKCCAGFASISCREVHEERR